MKFSIKILILNILALLVSCKGNKQNEQKIAAFKKQKHRFEFKGCDMYYNEQKVELYKPKSYYIKLFGDGFNEFNYHQKVPIKLNIRLKYIENVRKNVVTGFRIYFSKTPKWDKFYEEEKHLPIIDEGQYTLIDGVAFGHDVSYKELNNNLHSKGKHTFKRVFTHYSRGFNCKYAPLQTLSYRTKDKRLNLLAYSFEDPENKLNVE